MRIQRSHVVFTIPVALALIVLAAAVVAVWAMSGKPN